MAVKLHRAKAALSPRRRESETRRTLSRAPPCCLMYGAATSGWVASYQHVVVIVQHARPRPIKRTRDDHGIVRRTVDDGKFVMHHPALIRIVRGARRTARLFSAPR